MFCLFESGRFTQVLLNTGLNHDKDFASWVMLMLLLSSTDFFSKLTFSKKSLSGTLSECQTVRIQIRIDILSVLISIQTVCKGHRQTTKVAASEVRVKPNLVYNKNLVCKSLGDCGVTEIGRWVTLKKGLPELKHPRSP